MIGSAAARHAAKTVARNAGGSTQHGGAPSPSSIVMIGPSEPSRNEGEGNYGHSRSIFGAHYDEGRITRRTDPDPIWAELASRSISRYDEIRQESGGMEFYVECGHLALGPKGSDTIEKRKASAASMGIDYDSLEYTELCERFPYLTPPSEECIGIHETKDAGYISARGLVRAQTAAAQNMGVEVIDGIVSRVHRSTDHGEDEGYFLIYIEGGRTIKSKTVLVTAGAFCNDKNLLPNKLDITPVKTQTVHFILSQEDEQRLKNMPSIIAKSDTFWAYLLPPIKYPDSTTRAKIGGRHMDSNGNEIGPSREMSCGKEVVDWYTGSGSLDARNDMIQMMQSLLPNIESMQSSKLSTIDNTCAVLHTPTRLAYIGEVEDKWAVATGGNGVAAKSSDEIGRLAALCILDREAYEREQVCGMFCKGLFTPRYRELE